MKQLLAGYWAGCWFGAQLCALQNRAWLAGNTFSRSTCCSGRQGKCFGISLAGSHQQSPFPGFSVWIPGAVWLHLRAEAPVLLKPFLARLGHGSARCTEMQTQQQASTKHSEISSVCSGLGTAKAVLLSRGNGSCLLLLVRARGWCSHCLHASVANDGGAEHLPVSQPASSIKGK